MPVPFEAFGIGPQIWQHKNSGCAQTLPASTTIRRGSKLFSELIDCKLTLLISKRIKWYDYPTNCVLCVDERFTKSSHVSDAAICEQTEFARSEDFHLQKIPNHYIHRNQ